MRLSFDVLAIFGIGMMLAPITPAHHQWVATAG